MKRANVAALVAAATVGGFAGLANAGLSVVTINEVRVDQPGSDNDEYIELCGEPGTSLNGLFYIVIGDGTGGSGVIESVLDLSGSFIPMDGYFLAAEATFTLGGLVDLPLAGSNPLNFENSDTVTHMLVAGFTGANGADLDTDDDGALDDMPWASVLDSVSILYGGGGDLPYSSVQVGPDGTFAPGHIYRWPNCDGPWAFDLFADFPVNDTPGAPNVPAPAGLAALSLGGLLALRRRRA